MLAPVDLQGIQTPCPFKGREPLISSGIQLLLIYQVYKECQGIFQPSILDQILSVIYLDNLFLYVFGNQYKLGLIHDGINRHVQRLQQCMVSILLEVRDVLLKVVGQRVHCILKSNSSPIFLQAIVKLKLMRLLVQFYLAFEFPKVDLNPKVAGGTFSC